MPDNVNFISVGFGPHRVEETAYRGGEFVYPYAASTREGNGFSLRREGGWPSAPTVKVDEAESQSSSGVKPWGKLYEVDFTALPSFDAPVPGPYILDGHEWWLKGLNVATPGGDAHASLVAGSGLRITSNFHISYPHSSNGGYAPYLRWFMPLAQLGARVDVPMVLQFRLRNTNTIKSALAGFMDSPNNTEGPYAGPSIDHFSGAGTSTQGTDGAISLVQFGKSQAGLTTGAPVAADIGWWEADGGAPPTQENILLSVFRLSASFTYCVASRWTGSFPAPDTLDVPDTSDGDHGFAYRPGTPQPSNLGVYFSPQAQSAGSVDTCDMLNLCIWQVGA